MSDEKPPYFPLYVLDFCGSGRVEAMTTQAVGSYILLLCKAWHQVPPCSLPNDDQILARWSRLSDADWSAVKASVVACWELRADLRLYQPRLEREWRKVRELSNKRSNAGRIGARKKWQSHGNAIAKPKQTDGISDSESDSEERERDARACDRHESVGLPPDLAATVGALREWAIADGKRWSDAREGEQATRWAIQAVPMLWRPPDCADAIPRIVAHLRGQLTPWKSVPYAKACIERALLDWQQSGRPPWVAEEKPIGPTPDALAAARRGIADGLARASRRGAT